MIQNLRVLPLSAAVGGTFTHGKAIMLVSLSHIYIYIVHIAAQPNEISILSPSKS